MFSVRRRLHSCCVVRAPWGPPRPQPPWAHVPCAMDRCSRCSGHSVECIKAQAWCLQAWLLAYVRLWHEVSARQHGLRCMWNPEKVPGPSCPAHSTRLILFALESNFAWAAKSVNGKNPGSIPAIWQRSDAGLEVELSSHARD